MRWIVTGADSKTGEDVTLTFEAATKADAENLASYNGIFVVSVEEEIPPTPLTIDAPGRYHVVGTDWSTGMKTSWYLSASGRERARCLCEAEGIVITKLEYVGPE
jgi:hypothetical protein